MRLSDFKGKRGAKAMADLMRLVQMVAGDPRMAELVETAKDGDSARTLQAFASLGALLDDDAVLDDAVAVIAKVRRLDPDEVAEEGDIIGEFVELFTSDLAVADFLKSSAATTRA